jgi:hypothetical protein
MRPIARASIVIACIGSHRSASAQRSMFPDDSAAVRRFRVVALAAEVARVLIAVGDTLRITFHLTDTGRADVTFCVGRGYGLELATAMDTVRPGSFVDQESCDGGSHTLIAGQSLAWDRVLTVPPLRSGGSASLTAWADILDPGDCEVYGCGRAVIRASELSVQVVGARSP